MPCFPTEDCQRPSETLPRWSAGELRSSFPARLHTIQGVFKALNLAEAVGSSAVLARCYANASVVAGLLMMHKQARHYATRTYEVAAEVNDLDCTSYIGLIVGIYWVTVGKWDRAETILKESIAIAEQIRARRWAESALTLVIGEWRRGHLDESRRHAQLGRETGLRERVPQVQLWGLC